MVKGHISPIALGSLVLIGFPCVVESQQQLVKLSTTSARFNLSITPPDQGGAFFSTNQLFQFESATSKLFHEELPARIDSEGADHARSHVVVTSVHVERARMRNNDIDAEAEDAAFTLESVVSVTFSDVGLYGAMERAPITGAGLEDDNAAQASNLAAMLTETISSSDIMMVLVGKELVADDDRILELSFTEFNGSTSERGVYATETDIVSKSVNDGWPMFFAGIMMSLLVVSIASVSHWLYRSNKNRSDYGVPSTEKNTDDDGDCKSVHYNGDIDLEVATTASGILGLKGRHPQAENDENAHPNSMSYRRKRRYTGQAVIATGMGSGLDLMGSPKTQKSGAMSASSKHPLGITSMRRLDSFSTPQKPKSDRVKVYDIQRLTRT